MASINTFNNHSGATFNDNSITVNAQQNNTQFNTENQVIAQAEIDPKEPQSADSIRLSNRRGVKIDLFRIIMAMQNYGFFVDITGHKSTQKAVFENFGTMLGEDFRLYQKNLSQAANHNNDSNVSTKIFDDLKLAFEEYENSKDL